MDLNLSKEHSVDLKCVKCLERIIPPFKKCVYNHFVCGRCKFHCYESIAFTDIDSYTQECANTEKSYPDLDKLFKNKIDFCQFDCGTRGPFNMLVQHEDNCRRRNWPITCPFGSCNWSGFTSDLLSHMEEHPRNFIINSKHRCRILKLSLKESITLVMLYYRSYYFNDFYWVKLLKEEEKRFVVVQRQGGVANIDEQKMVEFTIFSPSSTEDIEGKIIESGYGNNNEELNNAYKVDITKLQGDIFRIFLKEEGTEILPETLSTELICPICYMMLCGEILICENGHSICVSCREKCEKCFCKADYTEIRNNVIENITNRCLISCTFSDNRCDEQVQGGKLRNHVECCLFRETQCRFGCNWEGPLISFYEHYNQDHNWFKGNGIPHKIKKTFEDDYFFAEALTVFGKTFFFKYKYNSDFVFRVEELTTENVSQFLFEIEFSNPATGSVLSCTAPCWSSTSIRVAYMSYEDTRQIDEETFIEDVCDENDEFIVTLSIYKKI